VSELPPPPPPPEFYDELRATARLLVVEEHVAHGGLGQLLAARLMEAGRAPAWFRSRTARGYPSGRYGSQQFHRRECGLDPAAALAPLCAPERSDGVAW
jgi:transketolase